MLYGTWSELGRDAARPQLLLAEVRVQSSEQQVDRPLVVGGGRRGRLTPPKALDK